MRVASYNLGLCKRNPSKTCDKYLITFNTRLKKARIKYGRCFHPKPHLYIRTANAVNYLYVKRLYVYKLL